MKTIIYLFIFLSAYATTAQQENYIEEQVKGLNKALLDKDSITLDLLLHNELIYGHSNGWEENKMELIRNNQSGLLVYLSIETDSLNYTQIGKTVRAKHNAMIRGLLGEKTFHIKLKVWQIWLKENSNWKLWARQAVKIE